MVRVNDLPAAVEFYTEVLGLRPVWTEETSVGMGMAETDAEVVLHTMDVPAEYGVHYLVDDVSAAVATCERAGCVVVVAPFDVAVGRCAVVADPFGNTLCLLDLSRGPRAA